MPVSSCLLLLHSYPSFLKHDTSPVQWLPVHPPAFSSLGHVSSEPHSHHDQWLTLTQLLHPARLILVKLLHWRFGPLVEMRTSKLSDSEL
uniref:Uncharacterized protein n=1 Tax=Populus trichocarpa TaxID=3694 RepID=A0A2K1Y6P4_POPTR